MNCTVCHKPTTSGTRHPECGALVVSVMEAADRYWGAGSGARYRARDKLEAAVAAAIRAAFGVPPSSGAQPKGGA